MKTKAFSFIPIATIAEIILGGTPKRANPKYWGSGYKWASASDVAACTTRYLRNTKEQITPLGLEKSNAKLLPKDTVVITARGTVGALCMLSEPMTFNQTCYGLIGSKIIDQTYLYFAVKASIAKIKSQTYGAVFDTITIKSFENIKIPVPSLTTQQKIAAVLSVYDDFIEINNRRIQLLEEMAQSLYYHWFVDFKFPGHEDIPMVDSETVFEEIPKGWQVAFLGEICKLTMGQSPKSEFYNEEGMGLPFHQGVRDFGNRFPIDRVFCTAENRIAEEGDILFSVRAPVGRMNIADKKIIIGRGLCAISHLDGFQWFTYHQLQNIFFQEDIIGGGTIFKAVTKQDVVNIKLVIPPQNLLEEFEQICEEIAQQIFILTQKNTNLSTTRDFLLPQLINGNINVSELDIIGIN